MIKVDDLLELFVMGTRCDFFGFSDDPIMRGF